MKIGIAPFSVSFIEFFINLSKYLEKQGHEVIFINPDFYEISVLLKNCCKVDRYPVTKEFRIQYNEFSDLIKYLGRLYQVSNINKLIEHKNRSYSKAYEYFNKNYFDIVLFWNGSGNVEKDVCKNLEIRCWHFENGYFPNTLQLNKSGVNCDSEFANLNLTDFKAFNYQKGLLPHKDFSPVSIKTDFIKRILYRLFDNQFNYLFIESIRYNRSLNQAKKRFEKLDSETLNQELLHPYIFFPLQVNSDTQIILNSKYNSMYHVLETVLPILKKTGLKILLKEHPFEVEKVDYSKFVDNKTVFLLKKVDINNAISMSEFVVCVNSSVGLQALELKKPVLLLGKSMYQSCPGAIEFDKDMNIPSEMQKKASEVVESEVFINHIKNEIFIKGIWRNPSTPLLHDISDRILYGN